MLLGYLAPWFRKLILVASGGRFLVAILYFQNASPAALLSTPPPRPRPPGFSSASRGPLCPSLGPGRLLSPLSGPPLSQISSRSPGLHSGVTFFALFSLTSILAPSRLKSQNTSRPALCLARLIFLSTVALQRPLALQVSQCLGLRERSMDQVA